RVVRDREVDVRELLRVRGLGAGEQEACCDDELRALADRIVEVRRVVARRVRLQADRADPELRLCLVQAEKLVLVEPAIVELADVADERDRGSCRRPRVARPGCAERRSDDTDCYDGKDRRPAWNPQDVSLLLLKKSTDPGPLRYRRRS